MADHYKRTNEIFSSLVDGLSAPAQLASFDVYGPEAELKKVTKNLLWATFHPTVRGESKESAAAWSAIENAAQKMAPTNFLYGITRLFQVNINIQLIPQAFRDYNITNTRNSIKTGRARLPPKSLAKDSIRSE